MSGNAAYGGRGWGRGMLMLLAGVWLTVATGLLAADWLSSTFTASWPVRLYLNATVVGSPLCFALYGLDKHRAVRNGRRISERTLHLWALAGGWPGAALGQPFFRHKTQKVSFRVVFWLVVLLHLGGVTAYLML